MGRLGASPDDREHADPDETERKAKICGFKSFQPCLSQPCGHFLQNGHHSQTYFIGWTLINKFICVKYSRAVSNK